MHRVQYTADVLKHCNLIILSEHICIISATYVNHAETHDSCCCISEQASVKVTWQHIVQIRGRLATHVMVLGASSSGPSESSLMQLLGMSVCFCAGCMQRESMTAWQLNLGDHPSHLPGHDDNFRL